MVGTSLGYSGEELKQFLTEERMRSDKEKERQEKEKQMEQERVRAFELKKIRLENETKAKAEAAKAATGAAKRLNECDYRRKPRSWNTRLKKNGVSRG